MLRFLKPRTPPPKCDSVSEALLRLANLSPRRFRSWQHNRYALVQVVVPFSSIETYTNWLQRLCTVAVTGGSLAAFYHTYTPKTYALHEFLQAANGYYLDEVEHGQRFIIACTALLKLYRDLDQKPRSGQEDSTFRLLTPAVSNLTALTANLTSLPE